MLPLPTEHGKLTKAELYDMANRFLRPPTKVVKTIARREKQQSSVPTKSAFVSPPCKPAKLTGPFRCVSLTETSYPLWDGEREKV